MGRSRVVALLIVAAASLGAGTACTSSTPRGAPWSAAPTSTGLSGTKADVCARVRTLISSSMAPLGTALGQYVGYRTATDAPDKSTAADAVNARLTAMSHGITDTSSIATDAALRTAAQTAATGIDALAADPTFLSDVASAGDIAAALDKLAAAVQPLSDACR
jgi:hypothetical protein